MGIAITSISNVGVALQQMLKLFTTVRSTSKVRVGDKNPQKGLKKYGLVSPAERT